jgi:hypothetical protein
MKELLRLLTLYILICCLLPIHYSFAADFESIDRDNDGINIDDIVYYVSHSESTVDANTIRDYMERVRPVNSIATADEIAEGISSITTPNSNATSLTLPDVPNGYTIAITQSSDSSVIRLDGTIIPPPEKTTVVLVLTVTRKYDNSSANTESIAVDVPGQSSITTGGVVTASSSTVGGEGMEKAFDGSVYTKWYNPNKPVGAWWIQYELTEPHIVTEYTVAAANDEASRDPNNWTLMGSNDGMYWSELDSRTNENFEVRYLTKTYTISNSTSYLYYRLDIRDSASGTQMQLSEIGLYGSPAPVLPYDINVAYIRNGGIASASSTQPGENFTVLSINDGDRLGLGWGSGGGWNDGSAGSFPDWVQIDFDGSHSIHEIDVITIQDSYGSPSVPTLEMDFSLHGITGYTVQYWDASLGGGSWVTVPNGIVTGNNKVWRKFTFTPVVTSRIRVIIDGAADGYSRLIELEAWTSSVN